MGFGRRLGRLLCRPRLHEPGGEGGAGVRVGVQEEEVARFEECLGRAVHGTRRGAEEGAARPGQAAPLRTSSGAQGPAWAQVRVRFAGR